MVAVRDYPSISRDASVLDGILALEQAQLHELQQDPTRHRDRGVLVTNDRGDIVGKLSMWAIIACLEPRYDHAPGATASSKAASRIGSARSVIDAMMKSSHRWRNRLSVVAEKTGHLKVGDLVHAPRPSQLIDEQASLETAIHQLVAAHYRSLLVTRQTRIVGVLRTVDVFEAVCSLIKGDDVDVS
jgi:CBS domain-containing protein